MTNNKLDKVGLAQLWARILDNFVSKQDGSGLSSNDFTDALLAKLNGIAEGAQVNIIEGVQVNGVDLQVIESGKKVNVIVPTGALASKDSIALTDLEAAFQAQISALINANTLSGYGITDAYTKTETDEAIATALSSAYKVKGSVAFANLPTTNLHNGDTYNVTDGFTVDNRFSEYDAQAAEQKAYPPGTNVVYVVDDESQGTGHWDALAGVYDFSGFLMKADLDDISVMQINGICIVPPSYVFTADQAQTAGTVDVTGKFTYNASTGRFEEASGMNAEGVTYYTRTAVGAQNFVFVEEPTDANIGSYYEYLGGAYVKTADATVVTNKAYFTVA